MAKVTEPAITYTWSIPDTQWNENPETNGVVQTASFGDLTDIIIETSWSCKGVSEDGIVAVGFGTTAIAPPADTDNFTAFDKVTPEQLKSWLFGPPDGTGRLSKADQEGKVAEKIRASRAASGGGKAAKKLPAQSPPDA